MWPGKIHKWFFTRRISPGTFHRGKSARGIVCLTAARNMVQVCTTMTFICWSPITRVSHCGRRLNIEARNSHPEWTICRQVTPLARDVSDRRFHWRQWQEGWSHRYWFLSSYRRWCGLIYVAKHLTVSHYIFWKKKNCKKWLYCCYAWISTLHQRLCLIGYSLLQDVGIYV